MANPMSGHRKFSELMKEFSPEEIELIESETARLRESLCQQDKTHEDSKPGKVIADRGGLYAIDNGSEGVTP